MKLTDTAKEVLRNAERQLVALAHDASGSRDYDGATSLLEAARRVKDIADHGSASESGMESGLPPEILETRGGAPASRKSEVESAPSAQRVRRSDYPELLRDGDTLIKVGWSKSEKSEYEHKSPKKALLALGHSLVNAGSKGRRFSMDKLLPINDPTDGTQLPDYQCYVSLAWLRQNGLVIQHGRQGYSLPKKGDLIMSIESLWERLVARS